MLFVPTKTLAAALIGLSLLLSACSKDVDSETVAFDFVQLYFVEDNVTEAAKLASGSALEKLEETVQEINAMGAKEPAGDKPLVKATMLEMQPISQDEMLYIYRVTSGTEVQGMAPVTANLWVSKKDNAWSVSKFTQEQR